MTTFHVHEDCPGFVENMQPKNKLKPVKGSLLKKTNRAALQQLTSYQQNAKGPIEAVKKNGKENSKKTQVKQVKPVLGKLPNPRNDLGLKPVVKRTNLISRVDRIEKEYESEIWNYLKDMEQKHKKINHLYMTKQPFITPEMRSVLVDWLVCVADEYQMNNYTVHLGVNYLDRFLTNISVIKQKFQLVGSTAMMIAGKVEEMYPPDTKEWSYLTGDSFTERQFIKMEQLMLKILNFEMNIPTIFDFLKHLCAKHKIDSKTRCLAMYLSELILLEGEDYLQHLPSKLASSSLALARYTLFKADPWSKKLEETAGYSLKQLSPVVQKQQKTFKSSPFKEQQAIQKKYATDKYQKVALLKPRVLVLDCEE